MAEPRAFPGRRAPRRSRLIVLSLILCTCTALITISSPISTSAAGAVGAAETGQANDRDVAELLQRVEAALTSGNPAQYLALLAPTADRSRGEEFARDLVRPGVNRAVVRERDRVPLVEGADPSQLRLIIEVFVQAGARGSVSTWGMDIARVPASGTERRWTVVAQERLTTVEGLYKLSLNNTRQYRIRNLRVTGEDLTLTIPQGIAFSADSEQGGTAYVLLGQGEMLFSPKPAAEKGQIKLFAGDEALRSPFNAAFIRLNPGDRPARLSADGLVEEKRVDSQAFDRAREIFEEEVAKSFNLDLSDLSRETWSLVPPYGDMLVEIRTNKFGTLTYTNSSNESEDISLFDRRRRRNISSYASERKLATRARFYSDNDEVDYDVQHYDIQSHFSPEREFLEGRTVLRLKVKAYVLGTLTLRLAESLVVTSITSPRFGRLLSLRVKGQNSVLVNLPQPLARGDELTMAVTYSGRLGTATPEREVIAPHHEAIAPQDQEIRNEIVIPAEPRMLYTNRSYWYPQSTVTDYATASMRLTVPEGLGCIATGAPANGNPVRLESRAGEEGRLLYVFATTQPTRYLAVVITRLTQSATDTVRLSKDAATLARAMPLAAPPPEGPTPPTPQVSASPSGGTSGGAGGGTSGGGGPLQVVQAARPEQPPAPRGGTFYDTLDLTVICNPRQAGRVRSYVEQTSAILSRYAEIIGDLPYPSFTLALVDDSLPGGHSPAYFALLHQPLPTTNYTWRNDPVSFDKFPQFFIAHELAHQYWGDAVGGENYHEQWLSEGFAQFMALLHAERTRSKNNFEDILRQMRRTSISYDRYGPIWLGYRLGHLQGDSRIFRALVYNKGALVLHMLRRLMGDDAFFRGLRRFYLQSRFAKVGTDDAQKAFEVEAGRPLDRFFERWIMQSGIPRIVVTHSVTMASPTGAAGAPEAVTGGPETFAARTTEMVQPTASRPPQGPALSIRIEQKGQDLFEFPLTVRLRYASGETEDVILPVLERVVERTLPLKGRLQNVLVNDDDSALVEMVDR